MCCGRCGKRSQSGFVVGVRADAAAEGHEGALGRRARGRRRHEELRQPALRPDTQWRPRAHTGIDLDAAPGTPIFAVADGVIDLARYGDAMLGTDILLTFRPTAPMLTYLARMGHFDEDGVLFAHYGHLSAVFVSQGQRVKAGTMIGRTGTSGNADQKYPHLHFEIRKIRLPGIGAEGLHHRIDPELMFQVDFSMPVEAATRGGARTK
jgi:murein DD-endopeptidase MepM/ murein hydrolase activator NlpD